MNCLKVGVFYSLVSDNESSSPLLLITSPVHCALRSIHSLVICGGHIVRCRLAEGQASSKEVPPLLMALVQNSKNYVPFP